MTQAISVSKLSSYIKQIFDSEELLHNISVAGEVFGVSVTRNVIYFSLKDEEASLPCVCFYPNYISQIIEGEKIIATGSPSYYTRGGKLNFTVNKIENFGRGKLYEDFLRLKQKLEDEGLFDQSHKKAIPKNIRRIGVITSKEGAVIQDIKNVAWRRNPGVDIVLFNTRVQGVGAENEIAKAIEKFGNYDLVDVIVVARGGGSLEDLSAYNTEVVARAAYNCPKPIVSAVGHETDFTIIDFVSDLRAPTPSAAAELLTFNASDKLAELEEQIKKFYNTSKRYIDEKESQLGSLGYFLTANFDKNILSAQVQLDKIKHNLVKNFNLYLNQKAYEVGLLENTLNKINPIEILSKGYVKVEQNNNIVKDAKSLDLEKNISIIFKDGKVEAKPYNKEITDEN